MRLEKRTYSETELVDMICTKKQAESYRQKGKFCGGKQRSMFLDKLSTYCEYEYDQKNKAYSVVDVRAVPLTMAQARLHKGIYQYLAPLILNEMINNHDENHKARLTVFDLAKIIEMVNDNYASVKYNMEEVSTELDIPFYTLYDYFNRTDLQIDEYLRRCIKYLHSENCVIANEVHVIQTFEKKYEEKDGNISLTKVKNVHTASDDEMEFYSRLVEQASAKAKAFTNYEQWYGSNSAKFKDTLKSLLDSNGIDYVCRAFEMWYVDLEKCKRMLDEYIKQSSLSDSTKMLGQVFKLIIDENAENRKDKKTAFDINYVEHFKSLSSLTILQGAEDVRKKLKTWKSRPEKMLDRSNSMTVEYREEKTVEGV